MPVTWWCGLLPLLLRSGTREAALARQRERESRSPISIGISISISVSSSISISTSISIYIPIGAPICTPIAHRERETGASKWHLHPIAARVQHPRAAPAEPAQVERAREASPISMSTRTLLENKQQQQEPEAAIGIVIFYFRIKISPYGHDQ